MAASDLPPNVTFDEVLDRYIKHVIYAYYENEEQAKKHEETVRNHVANLQREDTDEDDIFLSLADLNPFLGDPLAFYIEFVLKYDESTERARVAEKKASKKAAKAKADALKEFKNKRKCIELEQETRNKQMKISALTTASRKSIFSDTVDLRTGCYVKVEPDLSPGKNCMVAADTLWRSTEMARHEPLR